jgi:hypothetical protein
MDFTASFRKGKAFLLDVHSYPNDHGEIGYNQDGYILHNFIEKPLARVNSLVNTLVSRGFNFSVHKGGAENYLHATAERYGIPSLLIEWNENLENDKDRARTGASVVARWLHEQLSNTVETAASSRKKPKTKKSLSEQNWIFFPVCFVLGLFIIGAVITLLLLLP